MTSLAARLGTTEHISLLLRKAKALGLHGPAELIGLAVARGCRHYRDGPEAPPDRPVSETCFSNEELALALLSPCLPYNPRCIRVGAQMLGGPDNRPRRLAFLARRERAEAVLRHIAAAGRQTEPQHAFWRELLEALPAVSPTCREPSAGVMPHAGRYRAQAGITNPRDPVTGGGPWTVWLRPSPTRASRQ